MIRSHLLQSMKSHVGSCNEVILSHNIKPLLCSDDSAKQGEAFVIALV